MKKRILSIALILCMLLSVLPQVVFAEGEEGNTATAKDITLGYSALHDVDTESAKWDYVYFGTYNNNPIKWRVLSTEGNNTTVGTNKDTATYKTAGGTAYTGKALFMLSENTLGSNTAFGNNNKYQGSALQTAMKGIFSSDSKELKYVLKTTKTDSSETIGYINPYDNSQYSITWGGSGLSEDTLFALSAREVEQYLGSGEKYANRISGNAARWWLRSPYSDDAFFAGLVLGDGHVEALDVVDYSFAVRPALNLNLSSVLFTSAAVGGKSSNAAAGGVTGIFENKNYADITGNDGYKLTLLDESRSGFSAYLKSVSGNTATVSYSGATTGTNEYISVIIKNGDTVKYYGRIAAVTDASGEVDITLPSDFSTANGDVLCVFNEQYNGDKMTDYASKLIDVTPFDYTVNFDANGGDGTMASQTMTYGATANLSANTFTRNGYTFNGWNTKADGTGTAYSDGQSVTNLVSDASVKSVTLYAQWKDITPPVISGIVDGKTYCSAQTLTVTDNDGIASVTVNGSPVTPATNGQFNLSPAEVEQKIVVTDKAGNTTEITVTVNDGHTYEWQSENGRYWQKCTVCDHETEKSDIPQFEINGNDTVCEGHDWEFTFTLPEGSTDVVYGYDFENKGTGDLTPTYENGVYTIIIPADEIENESSFKLIVCAKTSDGFDFTSTKEVTVISEHTGGTADCTHKAKCEVCGEDYGEVNADNHTTLKHTEAKAATTEAEGNIEYWHCEECDKYFSDKDGKNEITLADTVIAKLVKTDDDNKSPQTGDNSHMVLWTALLFISGGTLAGTAAYGKKKKRFVK